MLLTNFCEGGDLEKHIWKKKFLNPKEALKIFRGLVDAVDYLFEKDILHRDIKPANILLNEGMPILADFGFAIRSDHQSLKKLNVGSPLYMAPECLENKKFS